MFEKEKNAVLFFLKNIQFTLRTWKNAIEIARAYDSSSKIEGSAKKGTGGKRTILIFTVLLAGIVGIGAGSYYVIHRYQKMPQKRITEKKETITPVKKIDKPTTPVRKILQTEMDTIEEQQPVEKPPFDSVQTFTKPEVKKYPMQPLTDTGTYLIIVANKATKSLYLLQKQDTWRIVKEYDIAIGEQEGRKETAGDRRTPEGSYFIIGRKERSELNIIYGPLAYVLDYPNEEDRREGRTGQGIWIHGTDPDSVPLDTKGCLEMNNSDLEDLARFLKWGIGTPVTIVYNEKLTDPVAVPDYRSIERKRIAILRNHELKVNKFNEFVTKWKSAWENKRIDEYASFYDTLNFKGQGQEWPQWKERKLRTFGLYDTIAISVGMLVVTDEDDHSAIVKFLQRYTTNLNNIENGKKLNLEKVNDIWKITGESTCPKEELLL